MSETAAEPTPRRAAPPRTGGGATGNIFQRKFGPLPGWGWMALAGVAAAGYLWYRNKKGASAAQAAASTDSGAAADAVGSDIQGQLSTIQTEIEALQGAQSADTDTDTDDGGGGKKGKRPTRHVSTGKETFNQIAKADHTSVAHIVSVSKKSPENEANLDKLLSWAARPGTRRKGVVYYT
jgi:hypothetical protein